MHGTIGRPRRVFLTTDAVGGVWRYSMAIATGLASHGWQCTIATLGPSPGADQRREAATIPCCNLLETGLPLDWTASDAGAISTSAQVLNDLAYSAAADTIHLHTPCLAAFQWHAPVVAVAHSCVGTWWHAVYGTVPPSDFQWRMALMAKGLRKAAAIIAPSRAMAESMLSVHAANRPIDIVNNGLEFPQISRLRRNRSILAAGRLWDRGKNLVVLDEVAGLLDVAIEAAGPVAGPDGARVTAHKINLLGTLSPSELRVTMSRAALFASPSLYEPFGLAVLEAAQVETPLVLADNPTFRELWEGAAIFVDPHDPSAWAEQFRRLLDAPAERACLGKKARERSARYTAEAMVEATVSIHRTASLHGS